MMLVAGRRNAKSRTLPSRQRYAPFMEASQKIRTIIDIAWTSYMQKVSAGLLSPENEKMMQLQLAQILQTLAPIFEYHGQETIKILLEVPLHIDRIPSKRVIDIVILYQEAKTQLYFPIELKCFREYTRDGTGKKRGAQNLGMFDYWADIENIEQYCLINGHAFGTQLTLTDDEYYVLGKHAGSQVAVYSTNTWRENVSGVLSAPIANRSGHLVLKGNYSTTNWIMRGHFRFIRQEFNGA